MNVYGIMIVTAMIAGFLLGAIADFLNLRNLSAEIPDELKDVYKNDDMERSKEYLRVRTRFSFLSELFSLALVLMFWFSGGFEWLDVLLRELIAEGIWRGIAYIGLLALAQSLLSLPFSLYSVFVIEERFGFNKSTPGVFFTDKLKALLLGALLGVPLLYLVLWLLEYFGDMAWLYAWAALTAVSFVIRYVAPTWIMPLFNKFTPLEDGQLREKIFAIAAKADFPLKNLFVMDGSKRSSKSNAFFTGFGKNKRIVLFDTLVEKHTADELVAVLAHEIGHYKKKHILQGMLISIAHSGLMLYIMSLFISDPELFRAFYVSAPSAYLGLVFFGMLFAPAEEMVSVLMNMLSRKNEYEADSYSVELTGDSRSMIGALKKLSEHNLSNLTPHPFYVFMNYSHPPVLMRINSIKNTAGRWH